MTTRRISWALIAVVVSMLALVPLRGAALPGDEELDPLPVSGAVLPTGVFIGTLKIVACTLDETGHLRLTGVLNGTVTRRHEARIPVTQHLFTALATLRDPGRTTDVVGLAIAPVALDSMAVKIRLAPITLDIDALPGLDDWLATLLPPP
jgi:hypothetical protein